MQQYFGKYRAIVVEVDDPDNRGRIRVSCPKILGAGKSAWCEPCVPVAYDNGGDICTPPIGEFVWIEFEGGNPNKPIYTGGLWAKGKRPVIPSSCRQIEWQGSKILFNEDGSFSVLKTVDGVEKSADVSVGTLTAESVKASNLVPLSPVAVENGGTGAITASQARTNLGVVLATPTSEGLISKEDKTKLDGIDVTKLGDMETKLDGIESGAQRNTVTGVKGSSESSYRAGNIELSPSNIGLSNVDNTHDVDKPVSGAMQSALDEKEPLIKDSVVKSSIVDADSVTIADSTDNTSTKRVLWGTIKTTLAGLFAPLLHSHTQSEVSGLTTALSGKAESSHTHGTDDITSGALPVVHGGTGATDATTALINIGASPLGHTHSKSEVGLGDVDNTSDSTKSVASASKLTTARSISVSGDATGSTTFDGSADVSIPISVPTVSTSAKGLMSSSDKSKLDGISAGAQVNSITGVKGDAESAYRAGNVNITYPNLGTVPIANGGTGNASGKAQTAYKADAVLGVYTSNGGQQPPSYIPSNTVKFNMMNALTGAIGPGYCDWMMMDTYQGSDVPWATAFGVLKASTPRAYIGVGPKGGSSWSAGTELLTTYNTTAHVIAAGWSNGWYYHKWSTGWTEGWYYTTYYNVNINNAWGSIYESGQYTLPATGLTMTTLSRYDVALSGASAGVMGIEIGGWNAGGNPNFWFTRGSAGTGITVHIVGHFFGY